MEAQNADLGFVISVRLELREPTHVTLQWLSMLWHLPHLPPSYPAMPCSRFDKVRKLLLVFG